MHRAERIVRDERQEDSGLEKEEEELEEDSFEMQNYDEYEERDDDATENGHN